MNGRNPLRQRAVLRLALAGFLLLALFFALRLALLVAAGPPDPSRPIEGWMTPRYIARAYDLPPESIAQTLGLEPGSTPRLPLARLAAAQGRDLSEILAQLEALRQAAP